VARGRNCPNPLARGENVLGREGADVVALHSSTVSRRHARVTVSPGDAIVEDLGSKNGTYVNQSRVTSPVHITDGDIVRLGSLEFTIRFTRAGTSTQTI
jgi:pSer/pThr/pTyr-binding forkhead associated (FHA) protein